MGDSQTKYKLEFQVKTQKRKRAEEPIWNEVVRPSTVKLMNAYLDLCGVQTTFISAGQADSVTLLEPFPSDDDMLRELRATEYRLEKVIPPAFSKVIRDDLAKLREIEFTKGQEKLITTLIGLERDWCKFYADFPDLVSTLRGMDKSSIDAELARLELLRVDRERIRSAFSGKKMRQDDLAGLIATLKDVGIITERKWGHKPLVRMENVHFLYYWMFYGGEGKAGG